MSDSHGPELGPFQWDDPLLLESQLTEDERMIRDTAREFAAKELKPRVERAYLEERTDPALFRLMGQAGLLEHGATVLGIRTFARELYPRLKEEFPDTAISGVA